MRKILNALGVLAVLLAATLAFAAPHHGPDEVVIDAAKAKRAAVTFPHAAHAAEIKTCDTCHHTNKGMTTDAGVKVVGCTSCHLDPKSAAVPGMREMSLTKNPFHRVCIDCHKEQTKGPTKCDDCHPKG
jgi:hypothetical protein